MLLTSPAKILRSARGSCCSIRDTQGRGRRRNSRNVSGCQQSACKMSALPCHELMSFRSGDRSAIPLLPSGASSRLTTLVHLLRPLRAWLALINARPSIAPYAPAAGTSWTPCSLSLDLVHVAARRDASKCRYGRCLSMRHPPSCNQRGLEWKRLEGL